MLETTDSPSPVAPLDPTIVALGGEDIPVTFRNGDRGSAKVRILEIDHFGRYIDLTRKERELAEFVCGEAPGWSMSLTPDSLQDIVEKADDLNFTRALRWIERRAKILARIAPVNAAASKFLPAASSRSGSSAPASV